MIKIERVKKFLGKIKKISKMMIQKPHLYSYSRYYRKLSIQKDVVLIESSHGANISGHLFYIMKELSEKNSNLKLFVVAKDVEKVERFLTKQNIQNVKVVKFLSKRYCQLLASAEYLLNDTTFYPLFNKKEGQKYINTWHGTPLKTLGKDVEVITDVANVQRNFYMADKIITSSDYMQDILASSHSLNGVYQGKMATAPSPRNSILLNNQKREEVRQKLHMGNKKVSFYMPTWRGSVGKVRSTNDKVIADLRYLSENIGEEDYFFVKLHPFQQDIDLSEFNNIFSMPDEYELYEFLTAVDVLITDYSSIMYDFLLTDRKIILYTYDKEEYFSTRGVYDDIDRYPFKQVETVEGLVNEMQKPLTTMDYSEMKQEFCPYDCVDGVSIVCGYIFNDKQHDTIKETTLYNGKETALILSGGFIDNGITTALLNTLDNIDTTERNYIVFFGRNQLKKQHYFRVQNLPEGVLFYPLAGAINGSFLDRILYSAYLRMESFNYSFAQKRVGRMLREEFYRMFGDLKVNHFIHYTGYERKFAEMLKHVSDKINTVMFIHTDMFQQHEAKQNYSKKIIFSAYEKASKVALVNKNLKGELVKHIPSVKERVYIMDNFLGEGRIRRMAEENLFSTLIPTEVDYSYNGTMIDSDHMDLDYLLAHKSEFFQSSPIYEAYAEIDVDEELVQIESKEVADKLAKKINVADRLLLTKELNVSKLRLLNDLFNEDIKFFINIGRYDYQKGHERLIAAFERVYVENQNARLIIVAPYGDLKTQTIEWARQSKAKSAIFILGRMSNPYTLLKYCDAFVLSSHFEGLGLVVYEALAVGTTAITVNLAETIEYLDDEAIIVDNSEDGLYQGMRQYLTNGDVQHEFDFSIPRERSLKEFEELMTI